MPSSSGSADRSCLNPERVGRDGFLRLQFSRRERDTVLSQSRFTLPLQALTPLQLADGTAYLMLLNPTGGILGGDHLRSEIIQETNTHVCLTTPSASRVYRTLRHPSIQETVIRLGECATLEYLPDHVIPHAGSALRQTLRVEMARGSRAILLDAIAAGRVSHEDPWLFREIDSRVEVLMCGKPVFLNRTRIVPALQNPRRLGVMEDFKYIASMGILGEGQMEWESVAAAMTAELATVPSVRGGISLLGQGGCVVRYLTRTASELTGMNQQLWDTARELVIGLPRFDHRKY
jgi:urease accessory protein